MTAPNLAGVSSIRGRVAGVASLGTTATTLVTCPTDRVIKLNSIIVANIDGTDSADATVNIMDITDSSEYSIAYQIPVQGQSTLVVLGKDNALYLEEGDELRATASAASKLSIVVSYDEITDV